MATKAMIYVPECNVDVFKTDADSHGVEIELLEVEYFEVFGLSEDEFEGLKNWADYFVKRINK